MRVKLNGDDWYRVTSDFGNQHPAHSTNYHTGIDLKMDSGTEIYSPVEGVVEKVFNSGDKGLGRGVQIKLEDGDSMILGHLSESKVEIGQKISEGDLIALSGNTGNSTGAHLHIGIKNEDGNFIDPDIYLLSSNDIIRDGSTNYGFSFKDNIDEMILSPDGNTILEADSFVNKSMMQFFSDWKNEGFFQAMYDKSFFEVTKDFFSELFTDIGKFILSHSDIFFLMPAIALMLATFLVGRNKYSKWILPLWFAYFVSTFLYKLLSN